MFPAIPNAGANTDFCHPPGQHNLEKFDIYGFACLLRCNGLMKELNPGAAYTQELISLLQEIVVSFSDADSRPSEKIALYETCRELQKTHRVKLVGSFIVISGNGKGRAPRASFNTQLRRTRNQLRLAQPLPDQESRLKFVSKA